MERSLLIAHDQAPEETEVIRRFFDGYDNLMTKQTLKEAVGEGYKTLSLRKM